MPAWLRSALTTFGVTFVGLVPLSEFAAGDLSWVKAAAVSALLTTARTLFVALNPFDPSYGIGANQDSSVESDAPVEG